MKIFNLKLELCKTKITILGIKFCIKHNFGKIVKKNFIKKVTHIRNVWGKRKIKVGFLVNEAAKWQYQSLYEQMEKSNYFEPVVLVTKLFLDGHVEKHFKTIDNCYNFFVNKDLNVRKVYDCEKKLYYSPKCFNVDILFYQQPYGFDDSQHPVNASKYALTCYVPYGLHLMENSAIYINNFHDLLWCMFVEDKSQIDRIKKQMGKKNINIFYVGYPKLDTYNKITAHKKKKKKKTIIYAPHHSFEVNSLNCATFQNNGKDILALAKKYSEQIDWVFKPHPRFKTAVVCNNIMTEDEINEYYLQWKKLGTIYEDGDYLQLFADSDALVTDCVSFLGEYLPTKNPIFHLIAPKARFNNFAKSFIDSFYKINDISNLEENLKKIILKNYDIKKDERLSKVNILFDKNETSAAKIINILIKLLRREQ